MRRNEALSVIKSKYAAAYGADPVVNYTDLFIAGPTGPVGAVCGYRRASNGPLFLESYLAQPIEIALRQSFGRTVMRHDIIEIGNLAANNAPAMVALWSQAANDLAHGAEIAVAVLTAPLRRMFARLGMTIYEIATANPAALGSEAARWGSYYAQDPIICAGLIADGQSKLDRFTARLDRKCA